MKIGVYFTVNYIQDQILQTHRNLLNWTLNKWCEQGIENYLSRIYPIAFSFMGIEHWKMIRKYNNLLVELVDIYGIPKKTWSIVKIIEKSFDVILFTEVLFEAFCGRMCLRWKRKKKIDTTLNAGSHSISASID